MKNLHQIFRFIIILIVFLILTFIFYGNYQYTVKILKSEYNTKQKLIEKSIFDTVIYADAINHYEGSELNQEMKANSLFMLDKYRVDPNVLNWDIAELKSMFGSYEIYIIDQNLKVVKTTYKPDLGLDFNKYPIFSKLLKSRLEGNSFVSDRVDKSITTGKLLKYSYLPTPDHKYLLELSANVYENSPIINNSDVFSVADKLKKQYSFIKDISIFKFDGNTILKASKRKPYYIPIVDNKKRDLIKRNLDSGQVQIYSETDSPSKTTFKYFSYVTPGDDFKSDWWNSYVIEILYNDNEIYKSLTNIKILFIKDFVTIAAVYFSFVFIILYLIHKFEHMAYHDSLTNLPNRKLFEKHIINKIADAQYNNKKFALLFIDLNNFKQVNDTLGHNTGDKLIEAIGKRLANNFRKGDVIARLGGDEFTVLLSDIESRETAKKVTSKINNIFVDPIKINEHEIMIKSSIGISIYPDDGDNPETLIKKADTAMYQAKKENHS